jgi:plastocyanin
MMRTRLVRGGVVAGAITVAAILAVSAAGQPRAAHTKLIGTVGKNNAFKIVLDNASGKVVKTLKAGTYTLVIHDDSSIHNYELDGPHGKSWTFTSVPFTGTKTMTIKFVAGKYKAYCAPHESTMFQHFTVK